MAVSVSILGALEGCWYQFLLGCWGLWPFWSQRQQQLRQRQQRRRCPSEILLFSLLS